MLWNSYRYKIVDNVVHILEYAGEETDIKIPEQIEGYPVVEIGPEAFTEHGAAIERIEVPSTVKRIGAGTFKMCMSLTELILHDGLEVIGESSLYVAPLTSLYIPATVRRIEKPCELGEISWEIDEKNPYYFTDGYALYHKKNNEQELVVVQKNDIRREYAVLEGTAAIGKGSFGGHAHIEKVIFPPSVKVIKEDAFESCQALREVVFSEGLEEIQADAFSYCVNLTEIKLPASLAVLGEKALTNTFGWSDKVNGITQIVVAAGNSAFSADENAFYEKLEDGKEKLVKYFGNEREYQISSNVSCIGWSACRRAGFRKIVIASSVRTVENKAFMECKNLEWIEIAEDQTRLYVPQIPIYRKEEVTKLLSQDETAPVYDYAGYDKLFETYFYLTDRVKMACCRLKYPKCLVADMQGVYHSYIEENLLDILNDIGSREDMELLSDLSELGFFTEENIDVCIEVINRYGKAKLMSFLLNYEQEHLAMAEFDFSL